MQVCPIRTLSLLAPLALVASTAAACSSTDAVPTPGPAEPSPSVSDPAAATASPSASPEAGTVQTTSMCEVPIGGKVMLPADDAVHTKEPMEWWYWTGHLQAADGRWFGYEEVFFRVNVLGAPGHMVHSALTDIDGNAFHHFAKIGVGELPVTANGFAFSSDEHSVKGGGGHDSLSAKGDGYSFDLELSSARRAVLQHGDGYTDYSFGGYTYYYSRERMDAAGTITLGDKTLPVKGTGWFDHQFGDIASAVKSGWDWFAFQLDDQRQMMLFVMRVHGKQVLVGASVTDADCKTTEAPPEQVSVSSLGTWQSPHTSCTYPAGWTVKVKSETFVVTPYVADQEVSTSTPIYWEGASKIAREDGTPIGRAYVELSGYCPPVP